MTSTYKVTVPLPEKKQTWKGGLPRSHLQKASPARITTTGRPSAHFTHFCSRLWREQEHTWQNLPPQRTWGSQCLASQPEPVAHTPGPMLSSSCRLKEGRSDQVCGYAGRKGLPLALYRRLLPRPWHGRRLPLSRPRVVLTGLTHGGAGLVRSSGELARRDDVSAKQTLS